MEGTPHGKCANSISEAPAVQTHAVEGGDISRHFDKTCPMEIPDCKHAKVMLAGHTVALGDHVFIPGGEVVGEAPSLTVYEVTVQCPSFHDSHSIAGI
jgi:hypothetical protein